MLQDDDEDLSFYDDNERYANKIATAIFEWSLIVGPILLLAKYLHIFDEVEYRILFIYIGLSVFFTSWVVLLVHKTPQSKVVKFICVLFEEMLICYLATTHGMSVYIAYIIPVIFTCLYHSHRFTHGVMLVSFVLMLGSIVYRGFFPTTVFAQTMEPTKYILYYGCGLSIEYIIGSVIILYIVRTAQKRLDLQHREEYELKREQRELAEKNHRIQSMQDQLISSFANLVESRDPTTGEHVRRTQAYVLMICGELKALGYYTKELSPQMIECMVSAACLHDIGKIRIPDSVLCKPGKLTKSEFEIIKKHTIYGERLISENVSGIEDSLFTRTACSMALCHHEWWNGQGYPAGLSATDIPLAARIMAVADVYDALISKRPYKEPVTPEVAFDIIEQLSGQQFDPHVVESLMLIKDEIVRIS